MQGEKRFANKVAAITGAAGGIGLATARLFGAQGAHVVLVDLKKEGLEKAEADLKSKGAPDCLVCPCDISKEDQVQACAKQALERFGHLDIIVNNAGLMTFKPIQELDREDWYRVLDVDLLGTFYFIKQAFLYMPKGGAVVNVSSIHAIETEPEVAPYAAAKTALLSLTRSAAIEGRKRGIRVNAVLPGAINTPMLWNNPAVKDGAERVLGGDVGQPEQLAEAIAFLASEDAGFVQGTSLVVDGGRLTRL